jgi:cytochrome c peroxidase
MRARVIAVAAALAVAGSAAIGAFGQVARQSVLPPGTVLDPPRTTQPRQMLRSEVAGGRQSFLVELGNTAFSAPSILGSAAQAAGLSCNTCHINGDANPRFFIPGMSSRPGNIDPTGPHFNPVADNFVLDPVDIPSLRGIRFTAPYGRDGRTASLREFTRNVIVGEFAGAEPSPLILDALVAYMNELEFIPNPQLRPDGALAAPANAAARRGEALFRRSFAGMGGQSCASCHIPTAAFVDGRRHDVGSDGLFDTPTLLNANATAPYFHDGRYATYGDVVAHFDRQFRLGLTARDRADLVAYLEAVGDAEEGVEDLTFRRAMAELAVWVDVLDTALAQHDMAVVHLAIDTTVRDMRRLSEWFPGGEPPSHQTERPDRRRRPVDYPALIAGLETIEREAAAGRFEAAVAALDAYHDLAESMVANYPRQQEPRHRAPREGAAAQRN